MTHVKESPDGEYSCMHCGGSVDAEGMAFGGDVKPEEKHESYNEIENALNDKMDEGEDEDALKLDEDNDSDIKHKARFALAIRRRKR